MAIYDSLLSMASNLWQDIPSSLLGSLIATAIVALVVVKILRVPSFDLHLDYIREKITDRGTSLPVLDVSIVNKKRWVGFGSEAVYFGLFVPVDFISNKSLELMTIRGRERWDVDTRGKPIFNINGGKYYLYRGIILVPVSPDARTHFLRILGSLDKDTTIRIYYYFETPYGRFPRSLTYGKRIRTAESGKLPYAEIKVN